MALKETIRKVFHLGGDPLAQATGNGLADAAPAETKLSALCRTAAAEGIVLLKNDGILPLEKSRQTAWFGRVQNDWFYVGYGSGGDVKAPYRISPMDALSQREDIRIDSALADAYRQWCKNHTPPQGVWGRWPTHLPEMPLSDQQIRQASENSECAMVVLGRAMGESMDNRAEEGWYYLTPEELHLLDQVTAVFTKTVVVINAGNIIDMQWVERYGDRLSAIVFAFHGGMESGNALIDVLYGDVTPSGKLTDTIAKTYTDYPASKNFGRKDANQYQEDIYVGYRYFETFAPERVVYPFGFGLSYTTFSVETSFAASGNGCQITATVRNTGHRSGAEVVQVYVAPPQGKLGKPVRNLVAFQKTRLLAPGKEDTLTFTLNPADFASYDDSGVTGHPFCYVLEAGSYGIYTGTDVRSAVKVGSWEADALIVTETLSSQAAPVESFTRIHPISGKDGGLVPSYEPVPTRKTDLKVDILAHLPEEIPQTGDAGISFDHVRNGSASMDAFIAQLDIADLDAITRGEGGMNSAHGPEGNAGMLGGTTESLRSKGVPCIITTDGPSGIRLSHGASLIPCGTALACSWNPALIESLATLLGGEMEPLGTHILLAPGMNIHRDPLCGRNFEYYSEDPLLTGKMAAAVVRGIQKNPGRSACPKHFACNNQEKNRSSHDSQLSERALREIYLRGFQICVQESTPLTLMTSYNRINGVWGHYHYELVTNILRKEWGYKGLVITDWWMHPARDPEFPDLRNDAYRVRAQVDVLMPGGKNFAQKSSDGSLAASYRKPNGITLGEMQRSARNVLDLILRLEK